MNSEVPVSLNSSCSDSVSKFSSSSSSYTSPRPFLSLSDRSSPKRLGPSRLVDWSPPFGTNGIFFVFFLDLSRMHLS